jgi:dipeptidyl-peptidase-4
MSEENRLFSFAPDSSHLLYLSDEGGHPTLYQVDLTKPLGKKLLGKRIITRPYSISDFLHWDNERIFFVANREHPLTWSLYYFNIRKSKLDKIADGVSYASLIKRTGGYITFSKLDSKGTVPYTYDVKADVLSEVKTPPSSNVRQSDPDPISAKPRLLKLSGGGSALLYVPDNFSAKRTYPMLVWLHGGPYRQTNAGYHPYGSYGMFDWTLEKLRQEGMAVLKVDYRGSYGYGRKFAESLREKVGKGDVADVLEAITLARARLKVGKVYLMGNSYGGFLALRTLVEKPSSFEGAVSVSGVTDWLTLVGAYAESIFRVHFGGTPDDEKFAPRYNQASIADRASRLTTQRALLLHGKDDTSVSFRQAQLMHDFLKSIKKNVELVSFEGEDHVFAKKATVSVMCSRVMEFMGYGASTDSCALE